MVKKSKNEITITRKIWIIFLSWLFPGMGQFLLGEKKKALLFFVTVFSFYWLGIYMYGNLTFPSYNTQFALFKFLGAFGSGINFFISLFTGLGTGEPYKYMVKLTNEYGDTFIYTAGIVNYLGIIDCLDKFYLRGKK